MLKQYSIEEARNAFARLVDEVEHGHAVEVTRNGQAVAVLISPDHYQVKEETDISLWERYEAFRREVDLEALDLDGLFDGLRDRSPGSRAFTALQLENWHL